jgi:hypothetical protein
MGSATLDIGPVHVTGALRARFARVIWRDGTLYVVANRRNRIERQTLETDQPQEPPTRDGQWIARSELGAVRWSRKGCSG